jgi:hypothetical protein
VVTYTIDNDHPTDQSVDLAVGVSISMSVIGITPSGDSPCHDLGNGNGFFVENRPLRANFFMRHRAFVTDVTTYYFGAYPSYWTDSVIDSYIPDPDWPTNVAFSWQGLAIPARSSRTVSFVISWGVPSAPPTLLMLDTAIPPVVYLDHVLTLTGTISDEDSVSASLVAVFGGDYSTIYVIARNLPMGAFSHSFRLGDASVREGTYPMDIYAVDETGEASLPIQFTIDCRGPTPRPTPTASYTPPLSDSPRPSLTRTPTPSPYLDIEMSVSADVDSKTNFRLQGIRRASSATPLGVSARGFDTTWRVSGETGASLGERIISRMAPVESGGLEIVTNVSASGSTAVVQFVITNPTTEGKKVSIALNSTIMMDQTRHARITTENGGTSFRIVNDLTHFQVFCKNYPMVTNVTSFWYGQATELGSAASSQQVPIDTVFDGTGAAISLLWLDREVAPRTRLILSTLMSWGEFFDPPKGTLDESSELPAELEWEEAQTIKGSITVSEANYADIVVYLVVDSEVVGTAKVDSDGKFQITFTPAALNLATGNHVFQVYAVDGTGSSASITEFTKGVQAPTPVRTATYSISQTPTASPTESASWGAVVDLPWYVDPGIEDAESGVSSESVSKVVIGVGIPVGIILIVAFAFLISRYRRAVVADMAQRLKSSNASEAGASRIAV